jgi:non-ribosomal peptide synthetase component F
LSLEWRPGLLDQLRRFGTDHQVSLFTLFSSALALAIRDLTGRDDVALGTIVANRRLPEFERIVGFFVNAVVLRSDCSGSPTFLQFLERQRDLTVEALDHQDVPFGDVIQSLAGDGTEPTLPYQGLLVFQEGLFDQLELPGLSTDRYRVGYDIARADFVVEVEEHADHLLGGIYYDADRFSERSMKWLGSSLVELLVSSISNPELPISSVRLSA